MQDLEPSDFREVLVTREQIQAVTDLVNKHIRRRRRRDTLWLLLFCVVAATLGGYINYRILNAIPTSPTVEGTVDVGGGIVPDVVEPQEK